MELYGKELSAQLDRALSALPVEQRTAFVLAEIEELTYAQIARIEQTSLGTVKSRIYRCRSYQRIKIIGERLFINGDELERDRVADGSLRLLGKQVNGRVA